MNTIRTLSTMVAVPALTLFTLSACDKKGEPTKAVTATTPVKPAESNATHAHDDDHHHGATTQLGEQVAGGFTIRASRDGDITPGKDAAIDVWVTGGTSKVAAVRFWIGTQDAKGSVKAKAELEKDNWHTHAEIPSPLPTDSKLWVEVESEKGEKVVAGFDLRI